jgi:two-component system sensor histidine kinase BaeS
MKKLFTWLLRRYLLGFAIFLLVQPLLLFFGIQIAMGNYYQNQLDAYRQAALELLVSADFDDSNLPAFSEGFFVYRGDGELIYSNRGKGRSIPPSERMAIEYNGSTIGYFYAAGLRFLDNDSNRLFFITLIVLFFLSLLISLIIALAVSYTSSGHISRPVLSIQKDIHAIKERRAADARSFDIRELSDISLSLADLSSILRKEEEYKKQWMQDISHDLRTPIAGLRSQLEGMRDGVIQPEKERFERNLHEVLRIEEMVEDISELSLIENRSELTRTEVSLKELFENLLSSHRWESKGIDIQIDLQEKTVSADEPLLARAISNILSNAFRHIQPKGIVKISSRKLDELISISIFNSGSTIPEDELGKIFRRFHRGEYARKTPGTGLGLTIAKEILLQHGGALEVQNVQTDGVVFICTLPQ